MQKDFGKTPGDPSSKELTEKIIDSATEVHSQLGPGLLETVYEKAMAHEFALRKIPFAREKEIRLNYKGKDMGWHRVDFLVANEVLKVRAPGPKSASEPGSTAALDDTQVSVMVRLSMGRPGIVLSSDPLKERSRFIALLDSMLKKDNEMWSDREEMEAWIDKMLVFLRDMAVLNVADETAPHRSHERGADRCRDLVLNADMHDLVAKIGKKTDMKEILGAYNALASVRRRVDFNLNKAITWNYSSTLLRAMVVHGS